MTDRIRKTEEFLREKMAESAYYIKNPAKLDYRIGHSIRVAQIAGEIAATDLWRWRIAYYQDFFRRLLSQLDASKGYLETEQRKAECTIDAERMIQLSGQFS